MQLKLILLCMLFFTNCFADWKKLDDDRPTSGLYIGLYPLEELDVEKHPVIIIAPYDHKSQLKKLKEYHWSELTNELIFDWHLQGGKFLVID